ncbi:Pyrimidine reductase, riboflavin biosynthesis [Ferrithrix thermotolerans DSM 19514]|uniref:Pyrimidine reductase, riboflavin biosynthesis n=1 Tax=Ferrithrix thermotolerans DSM 19514 TaxID=1121881 RepID=A0A1M4W7L5_9ACTN|nr:dihydrofolate reductase family protein [Ferrithrix thermotolerans]SHE76962.1 Pyrimidine reductase, riboflavin biosynthesis [Ferrithrix thermotolerans DSM 19514]
MIEEIDETISQETLLKLYPPIQERNRCRANLVTSINGSLAHKGLSRDLSSPVDRVIFHHLRAISSFVVVGARTAIDEPYGPIGEYPKYSSLRDSLGLSKRPTLVVVATRDTGLDRFATLGAKDHKVIVFAPSEQPMAETYETLELITMSTNQEFYPSVIRTLLERSKGTVLVEGGPRLLTGLMDLSLVDEICVTVAPKMVSKDEHVPLAGINDTDLRTISALKDKTHLYLRYGIG